MSNRSRLHLVHEQDDETQVSYIVRDGKILVFVTLSFDPDTALYQVRLNDERLVYQTVTKHHAYGAAEMYLSGYQEGYDDGCTPEAEEP